MEKLCGYYLVAAAVYSLVITLTSAERVSSITCTSGGTQCPANSACDTTITAPYKCKCNAAYKEGAGTAENTCVPKGLGDPCAGDTECNAVSNAECAGAEGSKKCACKANYKEENDQCSSANGLQTLLSAPIALLLSFLTIVVTRLH